MGLADLIGAVGVFALGVAVIFFSRPLPYQSEFGPGPGFLPFWLGVGFIGCAILAIIKAVRRYRAKEQRFFQPKTWRVVYVLITLIVTFCLLPVLGLSLGLALFTGFTMRMAGRHSWVLCGLVAAITVIGVRFIFGYWLDIPLPKGMIGL